MIDFSTEIHYKTARSGGKGGQNVNKIESLVEARWLIAKSSSFSAEEKERIATKLGKKMSKEGYLSVQCSDTRSQLENKAIAKERLMALVNKALIVPKKRKATKIPKQIVEKRLEGKRLLSEKKAMRKKDID